MKKESGALKLRFFYFGILLIIKFDKMSKETKSVSKAYYKLGLRASSFFDPISRLKVTRSLPGSIPTKQARGNKKIITAVSSGHITQISEEEYTKLMASVTNPKKGKKTKSVERVVINTPAIKTDDELESMTLSELKMHAFKLAKDEKQVNEISKMRKLEDLILLIQGLQEKIEEGLLNMGNSSEKSDGNEDEDEDDSDDDTTDDEEEDDDTEEDDDDDDDK